MKTTILKFLKQEEGIAAVEYGLLAGLIALAIITTTKLVGTNLSAMFQAIADKLSAATPAS